MNIEQARAAALAALDSLCTNAIRWETIEFFAKTMYTEPTPEQREEDARKAEERRKAQAEREARERAARQETVKRFDALREQAERKAVDIPSRWYLDEKEWMPIVEYAAFPARGTDEAFKAVLFAFELGFSKGFRYHKAQAARAAKAAARRECP